MSLTTITSSIPAGEATRAERAYWLTAVSDVPETSAQQRSRGPRDKLRPEHARPLDPKPFREACLQALAASTTPHPLLHERVSPHVILQDGADESASWLTDNPMAHAVLTLRDHYGDQAAYHSACWRLWGIGPLLERPELDPWVRSRTAGGYEIDETIFLVAATAPPNARGEFLVKPFRGALERWAVEHPDHPEEDQA